MDNARKKIWICLLCAVAVAIVVGLCYYVTDVRETELSGEGTLVSCLLYTSDAADEL